MCYDNLVVLHLTTCFLSCQNKEWFDCRLAEQVMGVQMILTTLL